MSLWDKTAFSSKRLRQYSRTLIVAGIGLAVVFEIAVLYNAADKINLFSNGNGEKERNIALVKFNEPITFSYVQRLMNRIEQIKERDNYDSILLYIASPGGSPSASHDLASYLEKTKKEIPIVFYVGEVAASGSYYAACAADEIVANPNAMIGSISVLLQAIVGEKAGKSIGIIQETMATGEFKQPYSFLKTPTPEMKKYLQTSILSPVYKNFLEYVSKHRNIPVEKLRDTYGAGRVFIATEVKDSLIDRIATYDQVVDEMKAKIRKKHGNEVEIAVVESTPKENEGMPFNVSFNIKLPDVLEKALSNSLHGQVTLK
jgi:protease-4